MDKEFLKGLGLTDEVIEKIIGNFNDIIGKSYVPVSRFNEVNEDLKNQKTALKSINKQLEELKQVNVDDLKSEITRLQGENKKQQGDFEKQIAQMKLNNAIEKVLTSSKAKNITAVKALLNMGKIKLNDDKIEGIDEQITALKTDTGTSFLFDADDSTNNSGEGGGIKGFNPDKTPKGTPPEQSAGMMFANQYNSRMGVNAGKE